MSEPTVMKGAEPWGADGDDVGVLVLHGFTGSPQSVRYWAEGIAGAGRTVLVPRLPGHGTTVSDLQESRPADWVAEAEMSMRGLRERCRKVFVCGLSMGGGLTFDLAARFADDIDGIVTVNAIVYSDDWRAKLLRPILGRLPLTVKGVADDIAEPGRHELAYDKVPTKAAASMLEYFDKIHARLGSVRCPALIMVSRQDHVVPTGNAAFIHDRIASADKEILWLERSYHVATLDYDRDLIVERTNEFVEQRMKE